MLSRTREVIVLEAEGPASGATSAAAGLANPFMGRKANAAWRHTEALEAVRELCDEAGVPFRQTGIMRPAGSEAQAEAFRARANTHAELSWWPSEASRERWPLVAAPHGTLWVPTGGSVDLPRFVEGALEVARSRGAEVRRERLRRTDGNVAITDQSILEAESIVLSLGDGARHLPVTASLPLHRVKGQTIRIARPGSIPADHPAVSGGGYAVPTGTGVVVGSTFEHTFDSTDPDPALDADLVARAGRMIPDLEGAAVLERRAGVRLTVPANLSPRRLPICGPVLEDVWVLTGLGAKGLMTAPLLARILPDALEGTRSMPPEVLVPLPGR